MPLNSDSKFFIWKDNKKHYVLCSTRLCSSLFGTLNLISWRWPPSDLLQNEHVPLCQPCNRCLHYCALERTQAHRLRAHWSTMMTLLEPLTKNKCSWHQMSFLFSSNLIFNGQYCIHLTASSERWNPRSENKANKNVPLCCVWSSLACFSSAICPFISVLTRGAKNKAEMCSLADQADLSQVSDV